MRGIALVAQEVALVPRLTVAENVFLGAEPRRAGFIDRRSLRERFDRLDRGRRLRPPRGDGRRPPADRPAAAGRDPARARARGRPHRPRRADRRACRRRRSTACTRSCADCVQRGRTVILVSHFLAEVLDLSDAVTVLRDGRVVRTSPTADETESSLVTGMLGRPAGRAYPDKQPAARGRTRSPCPSTACPRPGVEDATLTLRAGEIVGLAGLVGAGRSELARAIYGASPTTAGGVHVADAMLPGGPAASIAGGRRADPGVAQGRRADPAAPDPRERQPDEPAALPAARVSSAAARSGHGSATPSSGSTGRPCSRRPPARCPAATSRSCSSRARCSSRPRVLIADEPTRGDRRRGEARHLRGPRPPGGRRDGDPAHLERGRGDPRTRPSRARHARRDDSSPSWRVRHMTEEAIVDAAFGTTGTTAA